MQLTQHRNQGELFVRKADANNVVVVDRTFTRSLVLSADSAMEDFPVREVGELDAAAIGTLLDQQPEVVLLGTGTRAIFPKPSVLAEFLKRGVGLETMDNGAAARTFNVLAGEGRRVVAVFLLPG
ncbi:MAG: MTH938/NDUFAF3 family protein [Rudaea sp.]